MGIFRGDDEDAGRGGSQGRKERVRQLPLLPLRDIVVFPTMVVPLFVGRARSIRALEDAMGRERELLLCAQREAGEDEPGEKSVETEALVRSVHSGFETFVKLNKKIPPETLQTVTAIESPARLADTIAGHLNLKLEERQHLLEQTTPARRLEEGHARMQ